MDVAACIVTATCIVTIGACEKGKQPEPALLLFAAMEQQGLVPNYFTYNALISACEKGTQPDQALLVVAAMEQQGIVPDDCTYSAIFSAC